MKLVPNLTKILMILTKGKYEKKRVLSIHVLTPVQRGHLRSGSAFALNFVIFHTQVLVNEYMENRTSTFLESSLLCNEDRVDVSTLKILLLSFSAIFLLVY